MSLTSHQAPGEQDRWRMWLWGFVLSLLAGAGSLFAFVVAVDPFATGRFALTQRVDIATTAMNFMKPGVARDPRFDGAILGTSTAMRLDPQRLSEATGRHFVQLALGGVAPESQLVLARSFARHHRDRPILSIFVLDDYWCRSAPPEEARRWFPLPNWLYEGSDPQYLAQMFYSGAIETAFKRVAIWLGFMPQAGRADGYIPLIRPGDPEVLAAQLRALTRPSEGEPVSAPFPALDSLASFMAAAAPDARVALAFAPIYATGLPAEGSALAARMASCKERAQSLARGRPGTWYLDLQIDEPITRDAANFEDVIHYREPISRWFESELASLIAKPPAQ